VADRTAPELRLGDRAFQSRDISSTRYVWDPSVHKLLYGEDLSFFIIRLSSPPIDIVGELEKILTKANVRSFCIYKVYGFYDALIRVWCGAQQRRNVIESLQQSLPDAEFINEFRADEIYYTWADQRTDLTFATLQPFEQGVETISLPTPDESDANHWLEKLKSERLIHTLDIRKQFGRPVDGEHLVKLYVALSRTAFHGMPSVELATVRSTLRDVSELHAASLYTGNGFGDFMIKGIVVRYRDVDRAITKLLTALRDRRLSFRTMTLLIANHDAPEIDIVDVSHVDLGQSLMRLVRQLGSDILPALERQSEEKRQDVRAIYDEFASGLLGTPFERYFEGILEAGIRNDILMLGEKLSFIMRLEALLRSQMRSKLWPHGIGTDWPRRTLEVANELRRSGKTRQDVTSLTDVAQFTISDYVRVTAKLVELGELDSRAVSHALGATWETDLRDIVEVRNDVAHGNLYEPSRAAQVLSDWRQTARAACLAGRIYNRLEPTRDASVDYSRGMPDND
jgi:hypothetical protein